MMCNARLIHSSIYYPLNNSTSRIVTLQIIASEIDLCKWDLIDYRHEVFQNLQKCWDDPIEDNLKKLINSNDLLELIKCHFHFLLGRQQTLSNTEPIRDSLSLNETFATNIDADIISRYMFEPLASVRSEDRPAVVRLFGSEYGQPVSEFLRDISISGPIISNDMALSVY